MTNKEAIEILTKHNVWRRSEDGIGMIHPKLVGEAIDCAIKTMQLLRQCNGCGAILLPENVWMEDGCPCNSPKGCNSK